MGKGEWHDMIGRYPQIRVEPRIKGKNRCDSSFENELHLLPKENNTPGFSLPPVGLVGASWRRGQKRKLLAKQVDETADGQTEISTSVVKNQYSRCGRDL